MKNVLMINPEWGSFDKCVAEKHLKMWGRIYIDKFGFPIDDIEFLLSKLEGR